MRRSLLVAAVLVVLTACTANSSPPRLTLHGCQVAGVAARCGSFVVPEDRSTGRGRTIRLRVAVVPALSGHATADPVFWLAGGPGGSAIDDAGLALQILSGTTDVRDLVLVDQRGTGGSNDVRCPAGDDPQRWADEVRACLPSLAADPRAYTTAWAMDDLDDVRAALGYDRINLYGGSYGASAAQVYLQRHAEHARSAVLAAGTLLDVPVYERFPAASQRALDQVFTRCAADPACAAAFPDPAGDLRALTARLDAGPVPLTDPATGRSGSFTRADLGPGVHGLLLDAGTAAALPRLLHAAAAGDWGDVLAALGGVPAEPTADTPGLQMMELTITCSEPQERLVRGETDTAGSYLGYDDVRAMTVPEDLCTAMPRPQSAALYRAPKPVDVPVLLINGDADPQDPPGNVAGAERLYPDSLALTAPYQAHHYPGTACQAGIIRAFVERARTTGIDAGCLQDAVPPPFLVG